MSRETVLCLFRGYLSWYFEHGQDYPDLPKEPLSWSGHDDDVAVAVGVAVARGVHLSHSQIQQR